MLLFVIASVATHDQILLQSGSNCKHNIGSVPKFWHGKEARWGLSPQNPRQKGGYNYKHNSHKYSPLPSASPSGPCPAHCSLSLFPTLIATVVCFEWCSSLICHTSCFCRHGWCSCNPKPCRCHSRPGTLCSFQLHL